jgi:uncharacterized protein
MKKIVWEKIEGFEWDEGNKDKNWHKHKVTIQETEEIFTNKPLQITPDEKHSKIENRYVAFGKTNSNRELSVFFTVRKNTFRIISARDMSKKERSEYEKN